MKPTEYMDIINKIEATFPVDQWVLNDVHFWPLVRIYLSTNMQTEQKHPMPPSKLKMLYRLFLHVYEEKKYQWKYGDKNDTQHKADVVFLSHSVFKTNMNGTWYDRFVDPIRQELNKEKISSFQFEYVPRRQFRGKQFLPSKYIQSKLDFIKFKHEFSNVTLSTELQNEYELLSKLLKEYNAEQCLPPLERIARDVFIVKDFAQFFMNQLTKLEAKIGFAVYYYGLEGYAFNLACRHLGIPSVDIQHGVQGHLHRAYGRWNRVPVAGYEFLPKVFWCWTEAEYQAIHDWSHEFESFHTPIIGGYPWLELWKDPQNPLTSQYVQKVKGFIQKEEKQILVTLQKGRDVPDFLLQAIKEGPNNWKWWIRLHPAMMGEFEKIKQLFHPLKDRIIIEEATNLPLYSILANMDIHLTEWSSTVIEADAFQIPSILLHPFGVELFQYYIEQGTSMYAGDRTTLLNGIENLNQRNKSKEDTDASLVNQKGIEWTKQMVRKEKQEQLG